MPQSLARIHLHLVFSTRNRQPLIDDAVRGDLHAYMAGVLREAESTTNAINSMPDHAHVLFELSRTVSLADAVQRLKKQSSIWLRRRLDSAADFHWQNGYAAFSVSESKRAAVARYIRDQQKHHQSQSYQDELRVWLVRCQVPFDERYVWD